MSAARFPPSRGEGGGSTVPLQQHLERILDERDRRYEARFRSSEIAVQAALVAQKEDTHARFQASEQAIVKAEEAQHDYNLRSNEFRGQLDDQAKHLMPRTESLNLFKTADEKLETMRLFIDSKLESQRLALEHINDGLAKELTLVHTQTATLVTPQAHAQLLERIGTLEQANANYQGRIWAIGVGLTLLTIAISVVLHFI